MGADSDVATIGDASSYSISLSAERTRMAVGVCGEEKHGFTEKGVCVCELSGGSWSQMGSDIELTTHIGCYTCPVPHTTPPEHVVAAVTPTCPSGCTRSTPPAVIGATARSAPPPQAPCPVEESSVVPNAPAASTACDAATKARLQRVASRALVVFKARLSRFPRAMPVVGGHSWGAGVLSSLSIIIDIFVHVMVLLAGLALLLLLCATLACAASFPRTHACP